MWWVSGVGGVWQVMMSAWLNRVARSATGSAPRAPSSSRRPAYIPHSDNAEGHALDLGEPLPAGGGPVGLAGQAVEHDGPLGAGQDQHEGMLGHRGGIRPRPMHAGHPQAGLGLELGAPIGVNGSADDDEWLHAGLLYLVATRTRRGESSSKRRPSRSPNSSTRDHRSGRSMR